LDIQSSIVELRLDSGMSPLTNTNIVSKITNLHRLRQLHAQLVHHSLDHQNHWVVLLLTQCTRFLAPSSYTCHIFHAATHPDVRVFTCMLKYYSQIGVHTQVLVSLFKHMLQHCNIKPDTSFYLAMMKSAGSESMLFLAHVLKSGYDRD
jgi:hypothetical protein